MAISVSPTEVLKLFRDRGIRDQQAVAGYVEHISSVATDLVKYWIEIAEAWTRYLSNEVELPLRSMPMVARQLGVFYEASAHYDQASTVLRGRLNESGMNDLFEALGSLLSSRNRTKTLYTLELERIGHRELDPDRGNEAIRLNDLYSLIDLMQKEAATLRALAASIRSHT